LHVLSERKKFARVAAHQTLVSRIAGPPIRRLRAFSAQAWKTAADPADR